MQKMSDMSVFNCIFISGMISYIVFVFIPEANPILIYVMDCFFVGSLGGWQNLAFLIAELRVPPQSLGSVNMIAGTVMLGVASIVPFVGQLSGQWPLIVSCGVAIFTYLAMFGLPTPGTYLPKVERDQPEILDSPNSLLRSKT